MIAKLALLAAAAGGLFLVEQRRHARAKNPAEDVGVEAGGQAIAQGSAGIFPATPASLAEVPPALRAELEKVLRGFNFGDLPATAVSGPIATIDDVPEPLRPATKRVMDELDKGTILSLPFDIAEAVLGPLVDLFGDLVFVVAFAGITYLVVFR